MTEKQAQIVLSNNNNNKVHTEQQKSLPIHRQQQQQQSDTSITHTNPTSTSLSIKSWLVELNQKISNSFENENMIKAKQMFIQKVAQIDDEADVVDVGGQFSDKKPENSTNIDPNPKAITPNLNPILDSDINKDQGSDKIQNNNVSKDIETQNIKQKEAFLQNVSPFMRLKHALMQTKAKLVKQSFQKENSQNYQSFLKKISQLKCCEEDTQSDENSKQIKGNDETEIEKQILSSDRHQKSRLQQVKDYCESLQHQPSESRLGSGLKSGLSPAQSNSVIHLYNILQQTMLNNQYRSIQQGFEGLLQAARWIKEKAKKHEQKQPVTVTAGSSSQQLINLELTSMMKSSKQASQLNNKSNKRKSKAAGNDSLMYSNATDVGNFNINNSSSNKQASSNKNNINSSSKQRQKSSATSIISKQISSAGASNKTSGEFGDRLSSSEQIRQLAQAQNEVTKNNNKVNKIDRAISRGQVESVSVDIKDNKQANKKIHSVDEGSQKQMKEEKGISIAAQQDDDHNDFINPNNNDGDDDNDQLHHNDEAYWLNGEQVGQENNITKTAPIRKASFSIKKINTQTKQNNNNNNNNNGDKQNGDMMINSSEPDYSFSRSNVKSIEKHLQDNQDPGQAQDQQSNSHVQQQYKSIQTTPVSHVQPNPRCTPTKKIFTSEISHFQNKISLIKQAKLLKKRKLEKQLAKINQEIGELNNQKPSNYIKGQQQSKLNKFKAPSSSSDYKELNNVNLSSIDDNNSNENDKNVKSRHKDSYNDSYNDSYHDSHDFYYENIASVDDSGSNHRKEQLSSQPYKQQYSDNRDRNNTDNSKHSLSNQNLIKQKRYLSPISRPGEKKSLESHERQKSQQRQPQPFSISASPSQYKKNTYDSRIKINNDKESRKRAESLVRKLRVQKKQRQQSQRAEILSKKLKIAGLDKGKVIRQQALGYNQQQQLQYEGNNQHLEDIDSSMNYDLHRQVEEIMKLRYFNEERMKEKKKLQIIERMKRQELRKAEYQKSKQASVSFLAKIKYHQPISDLAAYRLGASGNGNRANDQINQLLQKQHQQQNQQQQQQLDIQRRQQQKYIIPENQYKKQSKKQRSQHSISNKNSINKYSQQQQQQGQYSRKNIHQQQQSQQSQFNNDLQFQGQQQQEYDDEQNEFNNSNDNHNNDDHYNNYYYEQEQAKRHQKSLNYSKQNISSSSKIKQKSKQTPTKSSSHQKRKQYSASRIRKRIIINKNYKEGDIYQQSLY